MQLPKQASPTKHRPLPIEEDFINKKLAEARKKVTMIFWDYG